MNDYAREGTVPMTKACPTLWEITLRTLRTVQSQPHKYCAVCGWPWDAPHRKDCPYAYLVGVMLKMYGDESGLRPVETS